MVNATTVNTPSLSHNPSPCSIGDPLNPSTPCSVAFQLARWCLIYTADTRELRERNPTSRILRMRHSTPLISAPHPTLHMSPSLSVQTCLDLIGSHSGDEGHVDKLLTSGKIVLDGYLGEPALQLLCREL